MLPVVIGHRGAAAHAPENTLESIRHAAAQDVAAVEVDVALSRDGIPVLFHDQRLDRTTDGVGPVAARTAAELDRLDAGSWFHPKFAGARVPRLVDAIKTCVELRLTTNLELKPAPGLEEETAAAAMDVIGQAWPPDGPELILSSFSMTALAVAKARKPDVPRAALFRSGGTAAWIAAARDLACIAVHVRRDRLTARRVLKLKAAGFACGTYTINRETTARRFLGFGVAYVFSDRPAEILAGLSR